MEPLCFLVWLALTGLVLLAASPCLHHQLALSCSNKIEAKGLAHCCWSVLTGCPLGVPLLCRLSAFMVLIGCHSSVASSYAHGSPKFAPYAPAASSLDAISHFSLPTSASHLKILLSSYPFPCQSLQLLTPLWPLVPAQVLNLPPKAIPLHSG